MPECLETKEKFGYEVVVVIKELSWVVEESLLTERELVCLQVRRKERKKARGLMSDVTWLTVSFNVKK